MSFNSYHRRVGTASKSVIKASLSHISESPNTPEVDYLSGFYAVDVQDVHVLNNPVSETKESPSAISDDEVSVFKQNRVAETTPHSVDIRSEEFAILSDSSGDLEELEACSRVNNSNAGNDLRSKNERIDDWCLNYVSYPKSNLNLDNSNSHVLDIAKSWGVDNDVPTIINYSGSAATSNNLIEEQQHPLTIPSYESEKLSKLTPTELSELTKFVKELIPYLLSDRALIRTSRCSRKYGDVPTLFPERNLLFRCSLDARRLSTMTNLYQQMKHLLLDTPDDPNYESLDEISLSSVNSSLPVESWYGWHMVPRFRETEF
ncbi:Atg36p Ecym_8126 [Eremothecium cymbalariae DBVPG|uniref:Uncharacterized protein n=1 Tax=Eremothecium cymbalariae (strain CBS 270.75 / DBVPG 7215 / KCTC 17166 / NRRL Y-17582) TaxID=931890 RepID=G8JX43_ERECY|nr:Hypothetical protein Ecym_8126 [Eremothecium cymbalariae DBVPG\